MPLGPAPATAESQILERFRLAAVSPRGLFEYPVGREALGLLDYDAQLLATIPAEVQDSYCGVGNPFAPGLPAPGEAVLDVGCGAGVDALFAARAVGEGGHVAGLEFSPDMLERARANAGLSGCANADFLRGSAERLPFADASFDLLVSNGVYNLVPDKARALAEAFRVLKPGGRLQVADQIRDTDALGQPQCCPLPTPGAAAGSWAR